MISIEILGFWSKKIFFLVLGFLLGGGLLVLPIWAQGDSSLWGSVTDKTDAAMAGATVVIRNLETGTERTLTTDASGRYNASALPVGNYEIAASKPGFQTIADPQLTSRLGKERRSTSSSKSNRRTKRWGFPEFRRWWRSTPKTTPAWSANGR